MGLLAPALPRVDLQMPPQGRLDDDLFFAICQANRDYRIERNARGDIQIMPPTGALTGKRTLTCMTDLNIWADATAAAWSSTPPPASTSPTAPPAPRTSPGCCASASPACRGRAARLPAPGPGPRHRARVRHRRCPRPARQDAGIPRQRGTARLADPARSTPGPGLLRRVRPRCLDHPEALADPDLLPGLTLDLTRIWQEDL